MTTLLFPGRHLVQTEFQHAYLKRSLGEEPCRLRWYESENPDLSPIDTIVFAITSANRENSRYNSIPFHVRAIGVDRFARTLQESASFNFRIIGIPHYPPTDKFAANILKEVAAQTEGSISLAADNCAVLCSTPEVITQFRDLGFSILPAELEHKDEMTPIQVVKHFVGVVDDWQSDETLNASMSRSTRELWRDFPDVPRRIFRLWNDPLLNDEGSLTETRDYATYAYEMANASVIQMKYDDIKAAITPGKIVDEGCADGAMLAKISRDYPDSDLIGIELTGEFMARCRERQRAGDFRGSFVHFYQRNILDDIFTAGSINTTICNSTIHELWSYGEQQTTVDRYLKQKFDQTSIGGRLVIRDVVGPANGDELIHVWFNDENGSNDVPNRKCSDAHDLKAHLTQLSTYGRFVRFTQDFLHERRATLARDDAASLTFSEHERNGRRLVLANHRLVAEFMGKMDYLHNWQSEMHEEFAFWSFPEWCEAVQRAGFQVNHEVSRSYCNEWIVENRYRGRIELFRNLNGALTPVSYPATNLVLVGEKLA